jgi:hypothetical protein
MLETSKTSLNISNSSDSTRKRYKRLIKKLGKKRLHPIDDPDDLVFIEFNKNPENAELPEKYRYPLRDDTKYKYVLREGIPIDKLNKYICANTSPGVFELLKDNPMIPMDWSLLAKHPDAFSDKDELINRITELETKHKDMEFWDRFWKSLCENTNPIVINFIKEKIEKKGYLKYLKKSTSKS